MLKKSLSVTEVYDCFPLSRSFLFPFSMPSECIICIAVRDELCHCKTNSSLPLTLSLRRDIPIALICCVTDLLKLFLFVFGLPFVIQRFEVILLLYIVIIYL